MPQNNSYQIFNQNCNSKILLLCDHATNTIPSCISKTKLCLTPKELNSHIAFDPGAKDTTLKLSHILRSPMIATQFSRLVIDPNRSSDDPTSIMQIYDGSIIPENIGLSEKQITVRKKKFYQPYHNKISQMLDSKILFGSFICIVSIHSFTPKLKFKDLRPWEIGILWDEDTRMSEPLIKELEKHKNICIGKNKPYSGSLQGDTLNKHGTRNKIPHVLIEIRNDLINSSIGQDKWALILANALKSVVKKIEPKRILKL